MDENAYGSGVHMLRRISLSVPEDGNIITSVHDKLITSLQVHQCTLQMFLGSVRFDLRFDVFFIHVTVFFDIGELVDKQSNGLG